MSLPAQRIEPQPQQASGAHPDFRKSAGNEAMLIKEIVIVALSALRANKMRSFLTMLGIVIGVAAVIAMVAIGKGAQKSISDRIANLGTTLLTVRPGAARGFCGACAEAAHRTARRFWSSRDDDSRIEGARV